MVIQHNILAMNANRMYTGNSRRMEKLSEQLSSGYKINRAADDAAGLAISEKMRRQIRGLSQASLNAQDGISMVQIADGAMAEVHDMLHRGTELSVKAANGTLTDEERSYIQREIAQIKEEIDAISDKVKFNEIPVLKGKDVPVPEGNSQVIINGGTTTDADGNTTTTNGQVTINHEAATLDFSQFTGTEQQLKELENNGFHTTCCTCSNHYSIKFTLDSGNSMEQSGRHYIYNVGLKGVTTAEDLLNRIVAATDGGNPQNHYTNLEADLVNKKLIIYDDRSRERLPVTPPADTTVTWPGWSNATNDSVKAGGEYGKFAPGTAYSVEDADKLAKVDLVILQVGAEKGHEMAIELPSISTVTLKIQGVDVSTQAKAHQAISSFKAATKFVSEERSRMGAYQNRLEHTIANLDNVVENTQAAESAVRDSDMAKLMVEYANRKILEQAGMAMLAQSNNNQEVLALLG